MSKTRRSYSMPFVGLAGLLVAFMVWLTLLIAPVVSGLEAEIARGYQSNDSGLAVGMAVAQDLSSSEDASLIERANKGNADRFIGVVTREDDSLVSVKGEDGTILVVTTGEASVYVSDINGTVAKGDLLTLSPLSGVLMKASVTDKITVGTALKDFDTASAEQASYNRESGAQTSTLVAKMQVSLKTQVREVDDTEAQPFLVLLGESITGQKVSIYQVVGALSVILLLIVVEGSIIIGAVKGSAVAVGRNPLSSSAIHRQLITTIFTAIAVLLLGLTISYVILWI